MILSMAGGRRCYGDFVIDGLRHSIDDPFEGVKYQVILGDDGFVARAKGKRLEGGSLREQPSRRGMVMAAIEPEEVLVCVAAVMGLNARNCQFVGYWVLRVGWRPSYCTGIVS